MPRVGMWQLSKESSDEELGNQVNSYDTVVYQIDCLGFKDVFCTVNGENIADIEVAKYIARQVENAFKDYANTDLIFVLSKFDILDNAPAPFAEPLNIHRRILQMRFEMRNLRRMIT
jgi:hypothetical protein